jgi:hypothetical protein
VRLWRLPQGQLVKTLRPPIGEGNEGKVNVSSRFPDRASMSSIALIVSIISEKHADFSSSERRLEMEIVK